ncbi:MAG: copper resistance protein CopC [Acidimicrobiia bacterium]
MRRTRRAFVFVIVTFTVLFALAAPAFAHAVLEDSNPAVGASLNTAPKSVTLTFSEQVDVRSDGIRVFDSTGNTISTGTPRHPNGNSDAVTVSLPTLDKGLYTVAWQATSADSHPIQGAFTWGYQADASGQAAQRQTANVSKTVHGDSTVGVLLGVMRFGVFVGLALLLGAGWFAAYLWPEGRAVLRVRQLLTGSLVLTALCTVGGFLLQGPYTSDKGLGDVFSTSQMSAVWDTRFGKVWVARLVLLVLAALVLRMMVRHRGPLPGWWFGVAGAVGLALSATPGLAGHASTGRWTALALPADMFHVLAMSVWLGGLVMLVLARTDEHSYARVAERFSGLALGAVVLITATGTFQALRQLEPFSALWDSDYGRILILKLVGFAAILLIAAFSRRLVHGPGLGIVGNARSPQLAEVGAIVPPGGDVPGSGGVVTMARDEPAVPLAAGNQSRLKRSVRGELVFGAVILALTSMLVNTSPPRKLAPTGPLEASVAAGPVSFEIHFGPADFKSGPTAGTPNQLHLTVLNRAGVPQDVVEMKASLSLPSKGIPPIAITLEHQNRGFYFGDGIKVPFPGAWQLNLTAFVTEVQSATASSPVTVG